MQESKRKGVKIKNWKLLDSRLQIWVIIYNTYNLKFKIKYVLRQISMLHMYYLVLDKFKQIFQIQCKL